MNQDINVLALVKGAERYVFLYDDSSRAETLRILGRYASNPELSFTWYDAAVLSQKIRQESQKDAVTRRFDLPQLRGTEDEPRNAPRATPATPRPTAVPALAAQQRHPAKPATVAPVSSSAATLDTAVTRFLQYLRAERNASELTLKSYREDFAALGEYLTQTVGAHCTPADVTTLELRGYVAALHEAGYAKTTIARRLASLRSLFRFGQREGWAKSNPAKPLRNPRKDRALPHFLSTADVARLLAAPPADGPLGLRDRAILETLYSAGLRVGELAGLNEGDLDLEAGCVRVRGKGRRERIAPLGSYALRALKTWLAARHVSPKERSGALAPVFINKFGRRLTTRSVARMLEKYLRETGLDGRTTPHTLRHSFATHLLDNGADIRSVQELLGHKSLVTTQIYTHMTTAGLKSVYEKAHPRARMA